MREDFGEVLIVEGWLAEQECRNPKTPPYVTIEGLYREEWRVRFRVLVGFVFFV